MNDLVEEISKFEFPRRWKFSCNIGRTFGRPYDIRLCLEGAQMGVHLSIAGPYNYEGASPDNYTFGLEHHSRTPINDEPPSHHNCWLLGGICWHDGTSMYAEERYKQPFISRDWNLILHKLVDDADSLSEKYNN